MHFLLPHRDGTWAMHACCTHFERERKVSLLLLLACFRPEHNELNVDFASPMRWPTELAELPEVVSNEPGYIA